MCNVVLFSVALMRPKPWTLDFAPPESVHICNAWVCLPWIGNVYCLYEIELKERNWDDKKPAVHWIDWEKPRMTRMNRTKSKQTQTSCRLNYDDAQLRFFIIHSINSGWCCTHKRNVMCNIGIMYELSWSKKKSRTRTLSGSCMKLRQ